MRACNKQVLWNREVRPEIQKRHDGKPTLKDCNDERKLKEIAWLMFMLQAEASVSRNEDLRIYICTPKETMPLSHNATLAWDNARLSMGHHE